MKSTEKRSLSLNVKLLSLLLALLLTVSVFLTGCGQDPDVPDVPTPGENTEDPQTPAEEDDGLEKLPADTTFDLIKGGKAVVRIVRSINAVSGDGDLLAAEKVRRAFARLGNSVNVETDFSITGELDSETPEILIGFTAHPESVKAATGLSYGDFAIRLIGKKLCVIAYTDDALKAAGDWLEAKIAEIAEKDNANVALTVKELRYVETADPVFSSIPTLPSSDVKACNPEVGVDELIVSNVPTSEYDGFVAAMQKNGYTLYASNTLVDNRFATFTSAEKMINVGFYAAEKEVRLTVEEYNAKQLPEPESANKYEKITTSQVTMIGLKYDDSSTNGMSILIRLTDGRFVIVDGGFKRSETAQNLIKAMKEQSIEYRTNTKVTVAAWILTHGHYDHVGVFTNYASVFTSQGVTVQRIITNRLSEGSIMSARAAYPDTFEDSEGQSYPGIVSAAKTFGCPITTVHAGQVFWFADMKLEILTTFENIAPYNLRDLNASSIIAKMTFTDKDKVTSILITGDATGDEMRATATHYGDYLKSDMVQVSHHGTQPYHDEDGTRTVYALAKPSYVLWPAPSNIATTRKGYSYNEPLTSTVLNPNFKRIVSSGVEGEFNTVAINGK